LTSFSLQTKTTDLMSTAWPVKPHVMFNHVPVNKRV